MWKIDAEFIETVTKNDVEVLCLQEVLLDTKSIEFFEELKNDVGMNYSAVHPLNEISIGTVGVAVLSRYCIRDHSFIKAQNPNIVCDKGNGIVYTSHDKGFLVADIEYRDKIMKVACGHMLPFHSFGRDSMEFTSIFAEVYQFLKVYSAKHPTVICGDFNTPKLSAILPDIYNTMISVINQETRPATRVQNDYIFINKEFECKYSVVLRGSFDHDFCLCDIVLRNETGKNAVILHLSDLHFTHPNTLDVKTKLKTVSSDIRIKQLENLINNLNEKIDYVVITGDITFRGNENGVQLFNKMFLKLIREGKLPPVQKFIFTPGNHDVTRESDQRRWRTTLQTLDGQCARPWLPEFDTVELIIKSISGHFVSKHGVSIWGQTIDDDTGVRVKLPFLLDQDNKVLIYAFNSSSISGTKIEIDDSIITKIEEVACSEKERASLDQLKQTLDVDPARIQPEELLLFEQIESILSKNIDHYERYKKIAILHHHITSISCEEEVKQFDSILNAGYFKRLLVTKKYQIVMHGHKHWPEVFYDYAISGGGNLSVISGGTVLGVSAKGVNGIYIHKLHENSISSRFIPLEEEDKAKCSKLVLNSYLLTQEFIPLKKIRKEIEHKLLERLNTISQDGVTLLGWSKIIDNSRVGSISTAYGLLILELLRSANAYYASKRKDIIDTLWKFKLDNGGWNALTQDSNKGSIDATIWVLRALYSCKSEYFYQGLLDFYSILKTSTDEDRSCNMTIANILNFLCDVDPTSPCVVEYAKLLLDSALYNSSDEIIAWGVKNSLSIDKNAIQKPSPAITAQAILALYKCQSSHRISIELNTKLAIATMYLLDEENWKNEETHIFKRLNLMKEDRLIVKHYTICWIIKAVLVAGVDVHSPLVQKAISNLYDDYKKGCWEYEGSHYIWAIYDAIDTILTYYDFLS